VVRTPKATKKRPGRPSKGAGHRVDFRMQKEQGDFLIAVGKRFGWGETVTEVVRSIIVAKVIALQESDFHAKRLPTDE